MHQKIVNIFNIIEDKPVDELLPYLWSETVAKHDFNAVTSLLWRFRHRQKVPTNLPYVLGTLKIHRCRYLLNQILYFRFEWRQTWNAIGRPKMA